MKPKFQIKALSDTKVEIDIFGEIGMDWWTGEGNTMQSITERLAAVNAIEASEVVVRINSLGGDLEQGVAIYDALKKFGDKLTVEFCGYCASAATVIAMAGKRRLMSKHGLILMHKCWGYATGNENELEASLEAQRAMNNSMVWIYSEATGMKAEDIEAIMNENNGNGRWMTYDEALEKGFVTGEATAQAKALYASAADIASFNLPDLPSGYGAEEEARLTPIIKRILNKIIPNMSKPDNNESLQQQLAEANANVESANAKVAELQAQITDITKAKEETETKNQELSAKVAELQALVDAHAAAKTDSPNGKDEPKEDSFAEYMQNSAFYQQAKEQLENN